MNKQVFENRPIYIMPASISGLCVYHALKRESVSVHGICDNNSDKSGVIYDNMKILPPSKVKREAANALFILCEMRYEANMRKQLKELGFSDPISGWKAMNLAEVLAGVKDIDANMLCERLPNEYLKLQAAENTLKANFPLNAHVDDDHILIPALDISITPRCTLRCRDCANLMQYYVKPEDIAVEKVLRGVDLLFRHIDFVGHVSIIGGEPFAHKSFAEIVRHVGAIDKVGFLAVTTNGTIVPPPEVINAIVESGATVQISNYGASLVRMEALIDILENCGAKYIVLSIDEWYDCCKLLDGSGADETVSERFKSCNQQYKMLLGTKLYHCAVLAHAQNLRAIPDDNQNYVDFEATDVTTDTLLKYFERGEFFPGCRYCSGCLGVLGAKVPVAIQTNKPLPYILRG